MRAVMQKVTEASVTVEQQEISRIGRGFLVLLGVEEGDTEKDAAYLAEKIAGLRVFEDADDKMNLSLMDTGGAVLLVSQFTLLGDVRHGRRPSFTKAGPPEIADALYAKVAALLQDKKIPVALGKFRAHMQVALINDGPVTILLDSRKVF